MADYNSWSLDDQGFRRDEDRNRWRNEGDEWRGSGTRLAGREEFGRYGRPQERGYGGGYRGERGRQRFGSGSEGAGRAFYDDRDDWRQAGGSGRYGQGERADYGRARGGDYSSQSYGTGGSERQGYGGSYGSPYGASSYGQEFRPLGFYESSGRSDDRRGRGEERGWWDRTADEVSSWFGDEDAERRRRMDERRAGEHRGRGPRGYTRSDERIREDVSDRLTDDPYVDASEIDVTVSSCEVTLSGTVDSRMAKRRAEDIAESVSGVRNVQNNLRVQQASSSGSGTTAGAGAMAGLGTAATTGATGTAGAQTTGGTAETTGAETTGTSRTTTSTTKSAR